MNATVVIPVGLSDEWRSKALTFVRAWWARHFPDLPVVLGELDPEAEWSKGAAVQKALEVLGEVPPVLVLADADSFLYSPSSITDGLKAVRAGAPWSIPHGKVYRLRADETERLHAAPEERPRLGRLARFAYEGIAGGGITIVQRDAFEAVHGVDPRFLGWGGEDVAFGWALATLAGPAKRIGGQLVHLWHPHPAPSLRGSLESEALVERYRQARGLPYRMAALVAGAEWTPREPLTEPVRFRIMANRRLHRLANGELVRFSRDGMIETTDPDLVELLDLASPLVQRGTRR